MKLVILITAKVEKGMEVAQAWQDAGAPGVSIVPGYGLHTLQNRVKKGDIELPPLTFSMAAAMASVLLHAEKNAMLFLSLVPATMFEALVNATTEVLGDLKTPDTGVMFVVDVEKAIGVRDHGLNKDY